jgi:hypothetical protein
MNKARSGILRAKKEDRYNNNNNNNNDYKDHPRHDSKKKERLNEAQGNRNWNNFKIKFKNKTKEFRIGEGRRM